MRFPIHILMALIVLSYVTSQITFAQDEPAARQPIPQVTETRSAVKYSLNPTLTYHSATMDYAGLSQGGSSFHSLIIPSASITDKEFGQIAEEMHVMAHIFNKKLAEALPNDLPRWHGTTSGPRPTAFGTRWTYLQGYGALFLTSVNFPLKSLLDVEAQKTGGSVDAVWSRTRKEIYGLAQKESVYEAEKVEKLQDTLLETLKHTTNIESLKPGESIAVVVLGRPLANTGHERNFLSDVALFYSENGMLTSSQNYNPVTTLTIHVKKSEVDRFAQEELTAEAFRRTAHIFIY